MPAKIIFLNGTSSSGKTTFAHALRPLLPDTFCYYASDQLADGAFRSLTKSDSERARFFDGFHKSIAAFADAGNNLLVEHIVEQQSWWNDLGDLLEGFDVFWVGVHAPADVLLEREKARADRTVGEAVHHLKTHDYCAYDVEIDTAETSEGNSRKVMAAWNARRNSKEA